MGSLSAFHLRLSEPEVPRGQLSLMHRSLRAARPTLAKWGAGHLLPSQPTWQGPPVTQLQAAP